MRLDRLSAPRSEARLQLVVLLLLDGHYLLRLRAHLRKRSFAAVLLVSCKTGVPVWVVSSAAAFLAPGSLLLRGKTALQLLLLVSKRLSGGNRSLPLDCLHLFQRLLVASHRTDPAHRLTGGYYSQMGGHQGRRGTRHTSAWSSGTPRPCPRTVVVDAGDQGPPGLPHRAIPRLAGAVGPCCSSRAASAATPCCSTLGLGSL